MYTVYHNGDREKWKWNHMRFLSDVMNKEPDIYPVHICIHEYTQMDGSVSEFISSPICVLYV